MTLKHNEYKIMNVISYGTILIKISVELSVVGILAESIHNRTNVYEADTISPPLSST